MTPFVGLSLLIHSIIIFISNIFKKYNFYFKPRPIRGKASYLVNSLIILSIFTIVSVNAAFMIKISLNNNSNFQIIEKFVKNRQSDNIKKSKIASLQGDNFIGQGTVIGSIANAASSLDYPNESIVDFFKSLGADSSFENRASIASKTGISDYIGSAEQNIKLFYILMENKSLIN
jgi:hypothetical protein